MYDNINVIPNFIIIPKNVYFDKRLNFSDKIMFGIITALSNNDKNACFCSNRYFINITNLTDRQIRNCLSNLKKYGYIKINFDMNKRYIRTYVDETLYKHNQQVELFDYDWINAND